MSMGYIPKKRLYVKRQRKLRKKYKNFSCYTCENASIGILCSYRQEQTPVFRAPGNINVKNCQHWKAKKKLKVQIIPDKLKKKVKIKDILEEIF